jgi:CRISPR type IV-associated protein Csf3
MAAFIVRIALGTPVILNPALTLDGLLARLAIDRLGDTPDADESPASSQAAASAAIEALPLERHGAIHKASILFAEGPAPATAVNMVRLVNPGKTLTADMVAPKRGTRLPMIRTHRDEFKSLLDGYTAILPRALWAFGRGDPDAVKAALDGVKAIGKKRAQGWGEVTGIEVEEVAGSEHFGLMAADGSPGRAVPWAIWREIGGRTEGVTTTMAKTGFPRWSSEPELCAVPGHPVVDRRFIRALMAD